MIAYLLRRIALHAAHHAGRGAGVLCAGAPGAGRPAGVHPAARCVGRAAGSRCARCTASTAATPSSSPAGCGARCRATWAPPSPAAAPVADEVLKAVGNTLRAGGVRHADRLRAAAACSASSPATSATRWIDKLASVIAVLGVSVPHYWLGMVLVIVFSVQLGWLPPTGAGPGGSADWAWDWEHMQHLVLPAITMSRDPDGHHRAHGARAGGRDPGAGVRRRPARQGPDRRAASSATW